MVVALSATGLRIVAGTANAAVARAVAACLHTQPVAAQVQRLPDGELRPVVGAMTGDDVYVVQPTGSPVHEHLMELLLLLDACGRAGAAHVTAVVPYFAYARQDRRTRPGEAIAARVVTNLIASAGADRLLVIDPHNSAIEAISDIPVEILTAVPVLATALAATSHRDAVVIAPDTGAVKIAERYASLLGLPVAVVHKYRLTGTTVHTSEVAGDVAGRPVILVDDIISTAGTIESAVRLLLQRGAEPNVVVAATHGLLVGAAVERLRRLRLRRLFVTDTVPPRQGMSLPVEVLSVAPVLADAIGRLHRGEPLDDLLALR